MEYLSELAYMIQNVAGVSTNTFRIEPVNTVDALAGRKVSFALPSNALLNMRSATLMFSADANQVAAAGGRLPPKITSLIDRVELSASGQMIQQGFSGQNVLHHIKDAITGFNTSDPVLGHPEIVRQISSVDGSTITTTNNELYTTTGGQAQFAVNDWLGFFGTCQPPIQDVGLLPDLILNVYFAGNEVLGSALGVTIEGVGATDLTDTAPATAAFKVYNLHLLIESIGLNSSVYDELISSEIQAKGFVSVPFKNYFSFSDTHTGSTRFSVQTQSLDRVWVATRATGYDTAQQISKVKGFKGAGGFIAGTSAGSPTVAVGLPSYDAGGSAFYGTNAEKYINSYFNFSEVACRASGSVAPTVQLQLNGSYIPTFKATVEEMYAISQSSKPYVHHMAGVPMVMSLDQYRNNFYSWCIRLNLPGDDSRTISGLDTRSVALNGYVNTTGFVSTTNMMVFAECSSVLRIGAGRQMNVII